jgi:hypothetical protein
MGIFRSIVEAFVGPVLDSRHKVAWPRYTNGWSVMIRLGGMPSFFTAA